MPGQLKTKREIVTASRWVWPVEIRWMTKVFLNLYT